MEDSKIRKPFGTERVLTKEQLDDFLKDKEVFSTDDDVINETIRMKLRELYPNKSKYEK